MPRAYVANHQEPSHNVHAFETHIILEENSISEEDDNISFQSTGQIEYSQEPTQTKQSDNSQEAERIIDQFHIDTSNEEHTTFTNMCPMTQDFLWRSLM